MAEISSLGIQRADEGNVEAFPLLQPPRLAEAMDCQRMDANLVCCFVKVEDA